MDNVEQTLNGILARLDRIESKLAIGENPFLNAAPQVPQTFENPFNDLPDHVSPETAAKQESKGRGPNEIEVPSLARVFGIGGALALISAGIYIVKLAIDSGWLTPARQVTIVAIMGLALLMSAFAFPKMDRRYATALPVTGFILVFIALLGAHRYYEILSARPSVLMLMGVTALGLFVSNSLKSVMLSYVAIATTYTAIEGFPTAFSANLSLAIYTLIWGGIFCFQAISMQRRSIYLTALMVGMAAFHSNVTGQPTNVALGFQFAQLLIFGVGIIMFSVKYRSPLSTSETIAHLPAIVIFYVLQAETAKVLGPSLGFVIPAISTFIVLGFYRASEKLLKSASPGGAILFSSLAGIVILHGYYSSLLTDEQRILVGLVALPILGLANYLKFNLKKHAPLTAMILFLVFDSSWTSSNINFYHAWPQIIFSLQFYALFFFARKFQSKEALSISILIFSHFYAMAALYSAVGDEIISSITWGLLAVCWLVLAKKMCSPRVAQTSLVIYLAAGFKLIVLDLGEHEPVIKIIALIIVGAAFFVGGWLYQRIVREAKLKS